MPNTNRRLLLNTLPMVLFGLLGTNANAQSPLQVDVGYLTTQQLSEMWTLFKNRFLTKDYWVKDDYNNIIHTEAIGFAMLASVFFNDKLTFDKLLNSTQLIKQADNLHAWKISLDKKILDTNNASDADIYIAWACFLAFKKWNIAFYDQYAKQVCKAVIDKCVTTHSSGYWLLPGKDGFLFKPSETNPHVKLLINPSYWVFRAFKLFQQMDNSNKDVWTNLITTGKDKVCVSIQKGLPADWLDVTLVDATSYTVELSKMKPSLFGYEAVRVPLFSAGVVPTSLTMNWANYLTNKLSKAWIDLDPASSKAATYSVPASFKILGQICKDLQPDLSDIKSVLNSANYYDCYLVLFSLIYQKL